MLGVIGTVPDETFPLTRGPVRLANDRLRIDDREFPVNRGTPALLAAAVAAAQTLGGPEVRGFLAGDIGRGDGSRRLYEFLEERLPEIDADVLTFHYLQPDVDWHNKVLFAVDAMKKRPVLIADAGFMYAAKMSGQAGRYDVFTPDVGELSFLADEMAPHPFYTRGFILHQNNNVPDLIRLARQHGNAAACLLVKGKADHVADENQILATIDQPSFEAMEAIGGTGDTLTGIVSALISTGMAIPEAAFTAAKANRVAGQLASPTPATGIDEIIRHIPRAVETVLNQT